MKFTNKIIRKYRINSIKHYTKVRKYNNKQLIEKIDKLIYILDEKGITNNIELFQNRKKLVLRNLLAGIVKGIGTGIGFTILTAIIVYILQYIIRLNIPVIGNYISDIVDIVQKQN